MLMTKLPLLLIAFGLSTSLAANEADLILTTILKEIYQEEFAPSPSPSPPSPAPQALGKGEQYVQEALAQNRARVQAEMARRKEAEEMARLGLDKGKSDVAATYKQWRQEVETSYRHWQQAREDFLAHKEDYKKAVTVLPVEKLPAPAKMPRLATPPAPAPTRYQVVAHAMELPIRDQGKRSTCAAFAALRAAEIRLIQKGRAVDLSEQYFYWASKPSCQQSPCVQPGSWLGAGITYGLQQGGPDIPQERDCPYQLVAQNANETQIPLGSGCRKGVARIKAHSGTLADMAVAQTWLERDVPVVAGFKLSPNFYEARGFVGISQPGASGMGSDEHAKGHALLLIGHMQLPQRLHASEGARCWLVANSWGAGYGVGGYTCLSDRWVEQNLISQTLVAITEVEI